MSENYHASCTVQLVLNIEVGGGGWGKDCSIEQVHKQGCEGARGLVEQMIQAYRKNRPLDGRITIVGTPKISAVIASVER